MSALSVYHQIKDDVSHVSAIISEDCSHGAPVTVGGRILSIDEPVDPDGENLQQHYTIALDDGIGEIYAYVSPIMKHHFDFLQKGEVVLLHGYVNLFHVKEADAYTKHFNIIAYDAIQKEDDALCETS